MNLVETEEEWMRIIHRWHPEFKITDLGDDGSVVSEIRLWAIGTTVRSHESLGHALAHALKISKETAWGMCKVVEDERPKNK